MTVKGTREDITILMELMMYQGRDVNLVALHDMFKVVHKKGNFDVDLKSERFDEEITKNFNQAIA